MKTRNTVLIALAALAAVSLAGCRSSAECPDPTGPSSAAIVLTATSSTNALFAGSSRDASVITASLQKFDRTPVANHNLYFEIVDALGQKIYPTYAGFFDGNTQTASRMTDGRGNVEITYYGPTAEELDYWNQSPGAGPDIPAPPAIFFIKVTAALEGNTTADDLVTLNIIRDQTEVGLSLRAEPNVLTAGDTRATSEISVLATIGGKPMAGREVYFSFPSTQFGFFQGQKSQLTLSTDGNGRCSLVYFGPLSSELGDFVGVTIRAQVQTDTKDPDNPARMPQEDVYIHLVKQ